MLLRSLHIASRQLFYLLVIGIILGLLGMLAAVWLSDEVAKRKDEIAQWASQQTGYPVEIGDAGLYWFDLIPKLEVRQVRLLQKTSATPIATADNMYLSLDILATLQQGEPVVADASINGVQIAIERSLEGQLRLTGLESGSRQFSTTSLPDVVRWFTWLKKLELANIDVEYLDKKQPDWSGQYQALEAKLVFDAKQWQGDISIGLPAHLGNTIIFSGQADVTDAYTLDAWQWQLQSEDLQLAAILQDQDLQGITVEQGTVSARLTASQNGAGHYKADMDLELERAVLASAKQNEVYDKVNVDRFQGKLAWQKQKQKQGWQLHGQNLQLQVGGESWPLTQFKLGQDEKGLLTVQADFLRLSDVTAVALLMHHVPEVLAGTKPAGDISSLDLSYSQEQGFEKLVLQAHGVAMLPWQDYPGANNLSFDLNWQQERGKIRFNSHQTTVYAETWLDDAVYLDSFTGQLNWQQQDDHWQLSADGLRLWNEDLSLQLEGSIEQRQQVFDTDITLTMQDVVVNRWQAYVPQRILSDDFREWSEHAFKAGRITEGVITMKGNPGAFPFEDAPEQGRFDMNLQIQDAQLHYAPGWPDLMNVNGVVTGQGNNLLIKSQSGNIAGFAVKDVTTTISNLVKPKPVLKVDGLLNGTTHDALAFLHNSPLKQRFGKLADWVQAKGKSDIQLALMIPLTDLNASQASGHVIFEDSAVTTSAVPELSVTAIKGRLDFDNNGVSAKNISAVAMGEVVDINVAPTDGLTLVNINGQTELTALNQIWPGSVPAFVKGRAAYLTQIAISEPKPGEFNVDVNIESDLQGVKIDAPAPLGKTPAQNRPLRVSVNERETGDIAYQLAYDNWLNAAFMIKDNQPHGQVVLGGEKAKVGAQGLEIAGHIQDFALDEWLAWQARQPQSAESALTRNISAVDITLAQIELAQQSLTDIHLAAKQKTHEWQIDLDAPQVKGQISLPHELNGTMPLTVDLDYLKLKLPQTTSDSKPATTASLWPSMRVNVAALEIDDVALGRLNLKANRTVSNWSLEAASLESDVITASATGSWTRENKVDRSQFDIVVSSEDLKALLAHFGYQQAIEARQTQVISKLNWLGDPLAFSRDNLNGTLDLTVGRGQLLDVGPGAAGRIFGLLSIAAIPRRLALDFSDLFDKGLDFSSINGHFTLGNGIARTDGLTMLGDSVTIKVMGPIDLINKTYNQTVKITPNVSSTLPLAGAVAGGPVGLGVGTAILLFDKLAGNIFNLDIVNLISYNYQLTGPWDDPNMKIVNPAAN